MVQRDKAEYISIIFFGLFCLLLAFRIETSESTMVSPRLVPVCIAGLIVALGVLQFIVAWIGGRRTKNVKGGDSGLPHEDTEDSAAIHIPSVLRIIVIPVVGFAYIWLFSATGYLISTAIIMAFVLFLFGTKKPGKVAIIAVSAAVSYYFIFIYLIGTYVSPGWFINLGLPGY